MKYSIIAVTAMLLPALGAPLDSADVVVTRSLSNATNNAALAELESGAGADVACLYTGFSGYGCTGTVGDSIGYDERCIYARGSTSFYISAGCPTMFVGLYEHKKCEHGHNTYVTAPPGTCHDVNTGYAWRSSSWTAVTTG
ncbi:hypothetical protein F5B21DRAFT_497357 [Xylaria acuta]|nr:hypothetical protein F5B21DRAFT_497357 [Xylaria acuta]